MERQELIGRVVYGGVISFVLGLAGISGYFSGQKANEEENKEENFPAVYQPGFPTSPYTPKSL